MELDGEDGEVVEPADDEVEPDGEVVVPREAARSPLRSHAVTSAVPRATETAIARGVSLIFRPPGLGGTGIRQQVTGLLAVGLEVLVLRAFFRIDLPLHRGALGLAAVVRGYRSLRRGARARRRRRSRPGTRLSAVARGEKSEGQCGHQDCRDSHTTSKVKLQLAL